MSVGWYRNTNLVLLLSDVGVTGSEKSILSLLGDIEYCREESSRCRNVAAGFSAIQRRAINNRCETVSNVVIRIEAKKNMADKNKALLENINDID